MDQGDLLKLKDYLEKNGVPPFKCSGCGKDCWEMRTSDSNKEEIRINFPCGCRNKQRDPKPK